MTASYRLAIQETVKEFTGSSPSLDVIDKLKGEGCWNNDWDASLELIKRHSKNSNNLTHIPDRKKVVKVFSKFYFGGNPEENPLLWKGFINNEELLVKNEFFKLLNLSNIKWGFLSGAERPSANFILEKRLGLQSPPLIAMGEAPDKPNPAGLIKLAKTLLGTDLGEDVPTITYLGDTIADVLTINNARKEIPLQDFRSIAIAPPHLHHESKIELRKKYESDLKDAGADIIISEIHEIINCLK